MLIYPAIDVRGGQCVRLRQGDYSQETVFGSDPAEMARRWLDGGARFLHLVDLDGARDGRPVNAAAVCAIAAVCRTASVPCQLGGGIRDDSDVEEVLSWGVERVILGTRALKDPAWLERVAQRHPGRVVLGIDARDGRVATDGWLTVSDVAAVDLARLHAGLPLAAIVCTDISRDGMLAGPNEEALALMARSVPLPVIASGGVTTENDVRRLAQLGLAGCIIGRALYEGRLTLAEALAAAGDTSDQ